MNNKPQLMQIEISKLKVHPGYQRTEERSEHHIQTIVKNFNPLELSPLIVAEFQGDFWVVDGQHRLEAVSRLGFITVLCLVYENLDFSTQAHLFKSLNKKRKTVGSYSIFKADLFNKDAEAVAIQSLLVKHHFNLSERDDFGMRAKSKLGDAKWTIAATSALREIYKSCGASGLDTVLMIVASAWDGAKGSGDNRILKGLAMFHKVYAKEYDIEHLIPKLSRITVDRLKRDSESKGLPDKAKSYALTIVTVYNNSKRQYRLDEGKLFK
jgi:hypothetical protein